MTTDTDTDTDTTLDMTGGDDAFTADPYPILARLREQCPVHQARVFDGRRAWLITSHAESRAAYTDPRLSNDDRYLTAWDNIGRNVVGQTLLQMDPPDHTRLRKLIAREFTVRRMHALQPRIEQIASQLLDVMLPRGRADLVESYALPLPMAGICELLGVPAGDQADFHQWSADLSAPPTPEAGHIAELAMTGYLANLIDRKRREPGEDLLSALVRTTDDGDRLSADELLGMAFLLLVGGHESTAHLISSGVLALLRHPRQLAALRADWSLLDGAVEEMLRYEGPVEVSTRYTTEPVTIGGTEIPAGEVVLIGVCAAARDPRRFEAPGEFDILRDEARAHIGFGHGVHHCIGAPLARLETRVAIRALLERCPELALNADPETLGYKPTTFFLRGLEQLPVRFGATTADGNWERAASVSVVA